MKIRIVQVCKYTKRGLRTDRAGLGFSIEAGEEKKRALLCKRKLIAPSSSKKRGDRYYTLSCFAMSEQEET